MPANASLLAPYVPAVVRRLVAHTTPLPAEGLHRQFPTVALFADVADSTKVANKLAQYGRLAGPEEMCRILNAYYCPLVSLLHARGGDVIGFAGDAVLAVWLVEDDADLQGAVHQATQAGLDVQRQLHDKELAAGIRLSLRITIGAGDLSVSVVGGPQQFWQLVAFGPPLDQIRVAGPQTEIGRVLLSGEAFGLAAGIRADRQAGGAFVARGFTDAPPVPVPLASPPADAVPEWELRRFVPRAVQASIDAGQFDFLDQCRTVTVLFVRVVGRGGRVPPAERWAQVGAVMEALQEATARYDGTVAHLMEDDKGLIAVLAFGLPPAAHEDDAARAVGAAVYLRQLARERGVGCAMGLSTGVPFCGSLGSPERRVYTVTGADVIRAARLMQLAADGDVLCDRDTLESARRSASMGFAPLPQFRLKGFDAPVRVYRVLPVAGDGPVEAAGLGRDREREQLREVLTAAASGCGRVVWLEGERGSGVSRLAAELMGLATGRLKRLGAPGPRPGPADAPWSAVWADLLWVRGTRDVSQRQEQVEAFFALRPELAGQAYLLNDLLGITLPRPPGPAAPDPRRAVHELLLALVDEIALSRPVLVLLENAHAFDPLSWELVNSLAQRVGQITLVLTAEAGPPDGTGRPLRDATDTLRVLLKPLSRADALELVARRCRASVIGPRFAALLEECRGNPGRVEQACDSLLAAERLVVRDKVCEVVEGTTPPVPGPPAGYESVGRLAERARLTRVLDEARLGPSRILLVEGESGIGKSRLLGDLVALALGRQVVTLTGLCSSVERATPYHPWRRVFADLLTQVGPAETGDRAAWALAALRHRPHSLPFAPLANEFVGMDLPEDEVLCQLTGHARADNLHVVLTDLITAALGGQPLLIVLEDAQWADSASWRLAALVRERVPEATLALSLRHDDFDPPPEYTAFRAAPWADRVLLERLAPPEARELARQRLGVDRVADDLGAFVERRAKGNPLFIEQIVDHLRAAGLVEARDGTAQLRNGAATAVGASVPDTLRGLVTSRIDRLTAPRQLTAKVAGVVGPSFSRRVLAAVHPDPGARPAVPEHARGLVAEGLIRVEVPEPEPVYDFPHPVVHQVCYELLPSAQRQALHRAAAEWYETESKAGGAVPNRLIAHHWGHAGVPDREVDYLAAAAEQALHNGAYREAVTGFDDLLRLADSPINAAALPVDQVRLAHWEYALGESYFGLGDLPAARQHLLRAVAARGYPARRSVAGQVFDALCQIAVQAARRLLRGGRRPASERAALLETAAAYSRLAQVHYYTNEVAPGTSMLLRSLNLAERAGPSPELALAYAGAAVLAGALRLDGAARLYARLAESVARQVGHVPTLATTLAYLAVYDLGRARWDRVRALATESLRDSERLGDLRRSTEAMTILAMLGCFEGAYAEARSWFARVVELARETGNAMHLGWGLNGQGEALFRLGEPAEAERLLRESLAILAGNQDRTEEVRIHGMLAVLALRDSRVDEARARADDAERVSREAAKTTCSTLEGFAGIAEVRFAALEAGPAGRADRRAAESACQAVRNHARHYPVGWPRYYLFRGRLLAAAGWPAYACAAWRQGIRWATRLRMPLEAALLHHRFGAFQRDPVERSQSLRRAAELYERLGARYELGQVRSLLDEPSAC